MKTMHLIYILIIASITNIQAQALITDRPDFTESAVVVPFRVVQIESGVERVNQGDIKETTYPNTLIRAGLGSDLELRLGLSGWKHIVNDNISENYVNDMLMEVKYQLTNPNAAIPMGILLVATLPTGDDEVSSGAMDFGLKWALARDLSKILSFGANVGIISSRMDDKRQLQALISTAVGISINEQLSLFTEAYAIIPQDAVWQPVLDGGFTFLITKQVQLDVYTGTELRNSGADIIIGGGLSFMFGY
ncbi:MAG: hypothetical protein GF313_06660 [Caldithrix sp.]|nr:hypothetical protein [Caldithrix sp.]